jgi:hypothetical protein
MKRNFNTVKDYPNLLAKSINEGISNSMAFKEGNIKCLNPQKLILNFMKN